MGKSLGQKLEQLGTKVEQLEGKNEQLRSDYKQLVEGLDERFEAVSVRNVEASRLDGLGSVLDDRFADRINGSQRSVRKLKKQVGELQKEQERHKETINEIIDAI